MKHVKTIDIILAGILILLAAGFGTETQLHMHKYNSLDNYEISLFTPFIGFATLSLIFLVILGFVKLYMEIYNKLD